MHEAEFTFIATISFKATPEKGKKKNRKFLLKQPLKRGRKRIEKTGCHLDSENN